MSQASDEVAHLLSMFLRFGWPVYVRRWPHPIPVRSSLTWTALFHPIDLFRMFYAVSVGRRVGVFPTWAECKAQIDGFKGCRYKKFATQVEAQEFALGTTTTTTTHQSPGPSSPPKPSLAVKPGMSRLAQELKASIDAMECDIKAFQAEKERELKELRRKLDDLCPSSQSDGTASGSSDDKPTVNERDGAPPVKRSKLQPAIQTNPGDVLPNFITDAQGFVQVFTDGACERNGQKGARAAIGVWWNHHHHLNISAPILEVNKQTNNSAEIQAATEAVRVAKASDVKRLCINTDSQFLINCITLWIKNWKKKGWMTASNQPVKNKEDLMLLDEELSDPSIQVTWNHVRGHAGIEGNEMADALARAGIRK